MIINKTTTWLIIFGSMLIVSAIYAHYQIDDTRTRNLKAGPAAMLCGATACSVAGGACIRACYTPTACDWCSKIPIMRRIVPCCAVVAVAKYYPDCIVPVAAGALVTTACFEGYNCCDKCWYGTENADKIYCCCCIQQGYPHNSDRQENEETDEEADEVEKLERLHNQAANARQRGQLGGQRMRAPYGAAGARRRILNN